MFHYPKKKKKKRGKHRRKELGESIKFVFQSLFILLNYSYFKDTEFNLIFSSTLILSVEAIKCCLNLKHIWNPLCLTYTCIAIPKSDGRTSRFMLFHSWQEPRDRTYSYLIQWVCIYRKHTISRSKRVQQLVFKCK